ncbi:F-box protein [Phanerochaete sordida]|uniref:F-box protein n=1 Tax=Phanerochaete sordida TaxID=48140 RepID=A0A9P3LJ50_9APHY|nr:F-box protein [Phanerochaete sordida]
MTLPCCFSQLPQELVYEILDDLRGDTETLKSCSLVCKTWHHRCFRNLFYRLVRYTFDPNSGRQDKWMDRQKRRPTEVYPMRIALNVRQLELYGMQKLVISDLTNTLVLLPRLRTLVVKNCRLSDAAPPPHTSAITWPAIHSLMIACYHQSKETATRMCDVATLLGLFSHISTLTLDGVFRNDFSSAPPTTLTRIDAIVLCPGLDGDIELELKVTDRPIRILRAHADPASVRSLRLPGTDSPVYDTLICKLWSLQTLAYRQGDGALDLHPHARLQSLAYMLRGGPRYTAEGRWTSHELDSAWDDMVEDLATAVTAELRELSLVVPASDRMRLRWESPSDKERAALLADLSFNASWHKRMADNKLKGILARAPQLKVVRVLVRLSYESIALEDRKNEDLSLVKAADDTWIVRLRVDHFLHRS